jgi:hypothetical protein
LISVLVGATIHQQGEIDAREYRVLRDDFRRGSPAYRTAIAAAMQSGDVSRWEYRRLLDRFRSGDAVSLVDHDATNLREERLVLAAMTRQIRIR